MTETGQSQVPLQDSGALIAGGGSGGVPLDEPGASAWLRHYERVSRRHHRQRRKSARPRLGRRRRPRVQLAVALVGLLGLALLVAMFAG